MLSAAASIANSLGGLGVGGVLGGLGALDVVFGLLLIVLGVLMFRNPESHTGYGAAILVVSLLSLAGGGGFLLGLILGCIGGVLGILFVPSEPIIGPTGTARPLGQVISCTSCGSEYDASHANCPRCGASRW